MKNIIICMMCVAVVVGCGKKAHERKAEKAMEKALEEQYGGNADVKIKDQSMSFKSSGGDVQVASGKNVKLPKDFPSDIYVPKGAKLKMAMQMPQGFNILFYADKSVDDAVKMYQKKLPDEGWIQDRFMDMGTQKMFLFKKDNRTVNMVVTTEGDKTLIQLATSQK